MRPTNHDRRTKLPGRFEELVRLMPPRAIVDDAHLDATVEMIDHVMASGRLTRDQRSYLETLVQLVEAYEGARHAVDGPGGIAALRHLLDEHGMTASALARLLGVHASMGSKILNGERALTVEHLRILAARFRVRADTFMEA
jgi:HTH-type transcriptional regulator/antitoxin HigA